MGWIFGKYSIKLVVIKINKWCNIGQFFDCIISIYTFIFFSCDECQETRSKSQQQLNCSSNDRNTILGSLFFI